MSSIIRPKCVGSSRTAIHFLQESCRVEQIRHYLQESCKYLTFQTNQSDSVRSEISDRFKRLLQDSCWSRQFFQDSLTDCKMMSENWEKFCKYISAMDEKRQIVFFFQF